jgi:DNA-directed RNA polymerase subunit omega
MMLYPSVNGLREKVDSSYTLCILAAKRARDIIDGNPVLTEVQAERPVSLATNEIAEDLITYRRVEVPETVVMHTSVTTEADIDAIADEMSAEEEEDAESEEDENADGEYDDSEDAEDNASEEEVDE